jgi:hypothetical protein
LPPTEEEKEEMFESIEFMSVEGTSLAFTLNNSSKKHKQ